MLGPQVRHSIAPEVAEHDRVAGPSAMLDSKAWKARFSTLEILVEIDEEGGGALAEAVDLLPVRLRVEKVAVEHELLANGVAEHLRDLEARQWRADFTGDASTDHLGDEVGIDEA